jgi:uncharacterized protein (DUF2384 family)
MSLQELALAAFGDEGKAARWMNSPKFRLDTSQPGASPSEIAKTPEGEELVRERLNAILHWMFS